MRWLLALLLAGSLTGPAFAHEAANAHEHVRLTVSREAGSSTGIVEVEMLSDGEWRGDVFVSFFQGDFRERKGVRPNENGLYRREVRLPEAGEWGVYVRYGIAQAGFAGATRIRLPEEGGVATANMALFNGFAGNVPGYVQPLGFLTFGVIALLTFLGLRVLLGRVRAGQQVLGKAR